MAFAGCAGDTGGAAGASGQTVVNFLNWGDYIDPGVIPQFEEENPDIKINMTTTDSNEAMYSIAATEGSAIHMMIPSEYMIQRMMQEGMLAELDASRLENYQYVEAFTRENCGYDPAGSYSLPYSWGTFGILYNETMVNGEITSWDALFDPQYSGRILMYDSMRDSLGVGLVRLGYSLNSRDGAEIAAAADLLIEQKPLVMAYGTDDLRMSMVNGSAALSVMYAGDAMYSIEDNGDLRYVVPAGGANIFVDAMCVMKSAEGATYDAALKFIDFMMRPETAAKNAEYTGYSTPEPAALAYISEDVKANNAFNPDESELAGTVYYEHLDQDVLKLYEEAWLRVKTA
jgi:spermidine/putrescine transport system substrate-binding protein